MIDIATHNDTAYKRLPLAKIKRAAENVLNGENITAASVSIVIVDDEKIHNLNRQYLNHDYPTDVITFALAEADDSDENGEIDGEIYISVETAREQAQEYGVSLTNELMRLAAHGTLHLAGYDDATVEQRATMKQLEDRYITW